MASSSSLVLRSLLKGAAARLGLGRGQPLSGLTPQAKALAVGAAAHESAGRVVLYVVPADAAIDAAVADVRFFLGAIEGIGDVALSGLVLPFPALQADPYRALTPHMRVSSARARALLAMATGAARVVVASAAALLQRLPVAVAAGRPIARRPHRRGDRSAGALDAARRSRLRAPGSGGRPRRVLPARRHPRRLPARRDLADPHRVHWRPGRVDPPVRPGHAALRRDARPVPGRAGPRTGRRDAGDDRSRGHGLRVPDRDERRPGRGVRARRGGQRRRAGGGRRRRQLRGGDAPDQHAAIAAGARPDPDAGRGPGRAARPRGRADRPARRGRGGRQRRRPPRHHPAGAALPRPNRRLGARGARAAGGRRDRDVRRRDRRPGRADGGDARRLRGARRAGHAHERADLRGGDRRRRHPHRRPAPARRGPLALRRGRHLRGGPPPRRGGPQAIAGRDLPVRSPRPEGGRPHRPRRQRHRRVRRAEADRRRRHRARVPRAALSRRRQAVRPGRAARPGAEVHRRQPAGARPPWRHQLGAGQGQGQEGHARHGRGAAEALRGAQGGRRPRLRRRTRTGRRSSRPRSPTT